MASFLSRAALAVAVAVLVMAAATEARRAQAGRGCDQHDQSFDYFLLVQQWPAAYGRGPSFFTLHGLWPSRNGPSYPCQCSSEALDMQALQPIIGELDTYWPTLMQGNNEHFWSHEWSKHGTCCGQEPSLDSQLKFFNTTVQLRKKFDFVKAFAAKGIQPGSGTSYQPQQLLDAGREAFGAEPLLGCMRGALSEVGLCLNKDLQPVQCDERAVQSGSSVTNCSLKKPISLPLPANMMEELVMTQ